MAELFQLAVIALAVCLLGPPAFILACAVVTAVAKSVFLILVSPVLLGHWLWSKANPGKARKPTF